MKNIFVVLLTCISFIVSMVVAPLIAIAENDKDFENYCRSEGIDYMSSQQYEILMKGLIDGSDYSDAYFEATGSRKRGTYRVDLDKQNSTTDTNFTKSSLLDKIKSALDLGKSVYDTTSDLVKNEIYGDSWDVEIPSAVELIGKTKIIYDSGVEELVTLGISYTRFYDKMVGLYRNKCQIYGTRQLVSGGGAGNAATDFRVSIDGGYYPVPYNNSSMLAYSSTTGVPCEWMDSNGNQQLTTTSCTFSSIGLTTSGGGTGTNVNYYLYFASLNRQGITYCTKSSYVPDLLLYCHNSKSNYRNYVSFPKGTSLDTGSTLTSIVYTVSAVSTNDYSTYVNQNSNQQNVYSPSISYDNSFVGGTTINNNNYNDYGYTYNTTTNTWDTDQTWYNSWQNEWNNQTNYNYNNTYITMDVSGSEFGDQNNITFDPFKEITPEPTYPTEPVATSPPETSVTTTTTVFYPPATTQTYPLATLPDYTAIYTIDMTVYYTQMSDLSGYAENLDDNNSFWIIRCMNYILNHLEIFSIFLLLFLLGLIRVILWK